MNPQLLQFQQQPQLLLRRLMSARMGGPKYAFPTERGFGPLYGSSELKPTNQKKFVEGDLPFDVSILYT